MFAQEAPVSSYAYALYRAYHRPKPSRTRGLMLPDFANASGGDLSKFTVIG